MSEQAFIDRCFMCDTQFRMGAGVYDGKYIGRYQISVCNGCWSGWWTNRWYRCT